jgi:site-specific recombinase XerD
MAVPRLEGNMSASTAAASQAGRSRPAVAASVLPVLNSTRLLDSLPERARYLHYSQRTEQAYVYGSKAFIRFHRLRHPVEMGKPEVEEFLSWLASERKVAASTHAQALSALLFLYRKVLCQELPWLQDIGRPRIHRRLPAILSPEELACLFGAMAGEHQLFAQLLYGTGLRLTEGVQLRVKDLDVAHRAVIVRHGKGGKDRVLMLPDAL